MVCTQILSAVVMVPAGYFFYEVGKVTCRLRGTRARGDSDLLTWQYLIH